jgi:hypothetical protein
MAAVVIKQMGVSECVESDSGRAILIQETKKIQIPLPVSTPPLLLLLLPSRIASQPS